MFKPTLIFAILLILTAGRANAAGCSDSQFVRANDETYQVSGLCKETAAGASVISFSRTNKKGIVRKFSGTVEVACGEKVFSGLADDGTTWYSVPPAKRKESHCTSRLPQTPEGLATPNDCEPTIASTEEFQRAQCLLHRYVWGPSGYPEQIRPQQIKTTGVRNLMRTVRSFASIERWTMQLPLSFSSTFYFYKSKVPAGKLALFQQGHRDAMDECGGGDAIEFLLRNGYDVVAFDMPFLGENTGPLSRDKDRVDHRDLFDYLGSIRSSEKTHVDGLRLFFEPVIAGLNEARSRTSYTQVLMTGISGGGWTTTWMAALDHRINISIPVAGSLPFADRGDRDMGDFEQFSNETYQFIGYTDLYALGAWPNRSVLQISNEFDKCCYAVHAPPPFVAKVQETLKAVGGQYVFGIDSSHHKHMISPWAIENKFKPFLGLKK